MSENYTLEFNLNQIVIIYCALSDYEYKQNHIDTSRLEAQTVSKIKKEHEECNLRRGLPYASNTTRGKVIVALSALCNVEKKIKNELSRSKQ